MSAWFSYMKSESDRILADFSGITQVLNGRLNASELHSHVDIFYYIDNTVKAKALYLELSTSESPDIMTFRKLEQLHMNVMRQWNLDSQKVHRVKMEINKTVIL